MLEAFQLLLRAAVVEVVEERQQVPAPDRHQRHQTQLQPVLLLRAERAAVENRPEDRLVLVADLEATGRPIFPTRWVGLAGQLQLWRFKVHKAPWPPAEGC